MGAIDLVIQIEAPPSIASGMQRIGRASHQVGGVSEAIIFPKFRGDLVACAAVTAAMHEGRSSRCAIREIRWTCWRSRLWPWWRWMTGTSTSLFATCAARRLCGADAIDLSTACWTCSPDAIRRTNSRSCGRGSLGIASRTAHGAGRARQSRWSTAARFPTAGCTAFSWPARRRGRARGRARRGNGLRVPARRDLCPGREPGASRRSRTIAYLFRPRRAAREDAVLARRRRRDDGRARAADGRNDARSARRRPRGERILESTISMNSRRQSGAIPGGPGDGDRRCARRPDHRHRTLAR